VTETTGGTQAAESRCPWCSSVVPDAAERCPSCGATLRDASASVENEIPGVTQVDPVVGARRQLRRPNRLVGWLADVDTEPESTADLVPRSALGGSQGLEGADAASIAPPSDEVRREMQRLELEALKAELEGRAAEARVAAMDAAEAAAAADGVPPAVAEGAPPAVAEGAPSSGTDGMSPAASDSSSSPATDRAAAEPTDSEGPSGG
jgi:hypothetical protein